jgi:hypothetical protein
MIQTTEAYDTAILPVLTGAAAALQTVKMGLYTNAIVPSRTTVIASLTEPIYVGYARQTLVWGAVERDLIGNISITAAMLNFQMPSAANPTTVLGYFLVFGAGPALLGAENLVAPIALTDALSIAHFVFQLIQNNLKQGLIQIVQ